MKNVILNKIEKGKGKWVYKDTLIQGNKALNSNYKDTAYNKTINTLSLDCKGINGYFWSYISERKKDSALCLRIQYQTYPHDASKTRWLYYCKISDTPAPKPKE